MRQWIIYGTAIIVLGGAAWYFGRPSEVPTSPPTVAATAAAPIEVKEVVPPAKLPEVIDLARAYEPVREPDEVIPGAVNPASFIAERSSPGRIPYAVSEEDLAFRDVIRLIRQTPLGSFLPGPAPAIAEHLSIMSRDLSTIQNHGLLNFIPSPPAGGELFFVPMGVPYAVGLTQPVPPNASIATSPIEALKVMPRFVPGR
jgi:hypothetical protein